jgi:hypothetical protein
LLRGDQVFQNACVSWQLIQATLCRGHINFGDDRLGDHDMQLLAEASYFPNNDGPEMAVVAGQLQQCVCVYGRSHARLSMHACFMRARCTFTRACLRATLHAPQRTHAHA